MLDRDSKLSQDNPNHGTALQVRGNQMSSINQLLTEINRTMKEASARASKRAEAEPPTSHPSGSGDNGLQPTVTGAKYKENTQMTSEVAGNASVENSSEKAPKIDETLPDQGTVKSDAGNHPSSTTATKTTITDPGTSSPASVAGSQKYAAFQQKYDSMNLDQLQVAYEKVANDLSLAIKEAATNFWKKKDRKDPKTGMPMAPNDVTETPVKSAAEQEFDRTKEAQAQAWLNLSNEYALTIIKQAHDMADLAAREIKSAYLQTKKAEEGTEVTPEESGSIPPTPAGEGGPPVPPPGAEMMPGGGGEGGGMGEVDPAAIEELLMVMMEKGIQPEELIAALQQAPDTQFVDPAQVEEVPPTVPGGEASLSVPPEAMEQAKMAKQANLVLAKKANQLSKTKPRYRPAHDPKEANRRHEIGAALDNLVKR